MDEGVKMRTVDLSIDIQLLNVSRKETVGGLDSHALDRHLAIGILRMPSGLDFSDKIANADLIPVENEKEKKGNDDGDLSPAADAGKKPVLAMRSRFKGNIVVRVEKPLLDPQGNPVSKEVVDSLMHFQRRQKSGNIDVWWIYDDGGLTLLIPYILSTRVIFSDCKLRVFSLCSNTDELDQEQRNLAALLSKFRISYSDVIVIPDIMKKAQTSTKIEFEAIIKDFRVKDDQVTPENSGTVITESELDTLRERTNRHMRLRELLKEHSSDATFIVMTLPMPRKGAISAPLYMAWLELLTRGMPPYLIVRGNQNSVLTFYS